MFLSNLLKLILAYIYLINKNCAAENILAEEIISVKAASLQLPP